MDEMENPINMDSVETLVLEAWKLHWEHCSTGKTEVVVQIRVAYTQAGTVL